MNIGWFIGLAGGSIVFFIASLIASMANYKNRFKDKYDFRNHFPYEFNYGSTFSLNILGNVLFLLSLAFSAGLYILTSSVIITNGYITYSLIAGTLFSIFAGTMMFVSLKNLKLHLILSVFLYGLAFATPAAIGLGAFSVFQQTRQAYPLVIFIVCMVFGFSAFIFVMNPKLSLNIKMQKAVDPNGQEVYVRPKFINVAFTEWVMIFELFICHILLILALIAIL